MRAGVLVAMLALILFPLRASAADPPVLAVPVLDAAPAIAGNIDESWTKAASLALTTDYTYRRAVSEPTNVRIAQDENSLDVAFDVTQSERLTDVAETNGSSVQSDDYVGVYLYPGGTQGFSYSFLANPRGARYQTSSENSAYAPTWAAAGRRTHAGYAVTMRIPLAAIRSSGATSWRVQFVRATVASNSIDIWSYVERQSGAVDPNFAGTLTEIGLRTTVSSRPKPRAQLYALGDLTPASNGGTTSRVGGDLALPVTPTASFVATLHPDFSNVEVDQQTIAPTAFARQYNEVRPFFTQVASPFNGHIGCINCPTTLYTPAIPTFREGYALEGTQGPLTFGAFDAIGNSRLDAGETINFQHSDPNRTYGFNTQRISVDGVGGLHDDATTWSGGYANLHSHLIAYGNAGEDRGSAVTNNRLADYAEYGVGYAAATTTAILTYQRIGAQFNPFDGFVQQNDIEGLTGFVNQTWNFSKTAPLHDISVNAFLGDFHDHFGQPAQHNASAQVNFDARNLVSLHLFTSYSGIKTFSGELLPFDSNGFFLGYKAQTSTPTYLTYSGGPYYHGTLDAWTYLTTQPLAKKVHVTLETDESNYLSVSANERRSVLWLERASLDYQINRDASFDLGTRRIFGSNIPNAIAPPNFTPFNAGNASFAFHLLRGKNEFYAVYGDPNSLATTPAFIVKWIRYIGAGKGT